MSEVNEGTQDWGDDTEEIRYDNIPAQTKPATHTPRAWHQGPDFFLIGQDERKRLEAYALAIEPANTILGLARQHQADANRPDCFNENELPIKDYYRELRQVPDQQTVDTAIFTSTQMTLMLARDIDNVIPLEGLEAGNLLKAVDTGSRMIDIIALRKPEGLKRMVDRTLKDKSTGVEEAISSAKGRFAAAHGKLAPIEAFRQSPEHKAQLYTSLAASLSQAINSTSGSK